MNRFTQSPPAALGAEGAATPPPAAGGQMMPPQAPNAMGAPPGGGGGPSLPAPPPTPDMINTARTHIGAIVSGLTGVLAKPRGELTKKDVFDAASEMIARGAFPTPESKQMLISELANLPDDEPDLRRALGTLLLQTADMKHRIHAMHGPGEP